MKNGYIDFWRSAGWGFIETETGERFFLHISAIVSGQPMTGALVTFDDGRTRKGPCAVNVRVVQSVVDALTAAAAAVKS